MHFSDLDIDIPSKMSNNVKQQLVKSSINSNKIHASGVYFYKHVLQYEKIALVDYKTMEKQGYQKIDILNNTFLDDITSNEFDDFINKIENEEIDWKKLHDFDTPYQLGNYPTLLKELNVCSVMDVAIALAVIRPGAKKQLPKLKKNMNKIAFKNSNEYLKSTYDVPIFQEQFEFLNIDDGVYRYKKPHAVGYAYVLLVDFLKKTSKK